MNQPGPDYLGPRTRTDNRSSKEIRDQAIGPVNYYPFGFVAGCIWADDSSWKIQYLDLSEIEKGVLGRRSFRLHRTVRTDVPTASNPCGHYQFDTEKISRITIPIQKHFDLATCVMIEEDPFA